MLTNMLAMCTSIVTWQRSSGKLPPFAALHKTGEPEVFQVDSVSWRAGDR
jgi:hypothetical protein